MTAPYQFIDCGGGLYIPAHAIQMLVALDASDPERVRLTYVNNTITELTAEQSKKFLEVLGLKAPLIRLAKPTFKP